MGGPGPVEPPLPADESYPGKRSITAIMITRDRQRAMLVRRYESPALPL